MAKSGSSRVWAGHLGRGLGAEAISPTRHVTGRASPASRARVVLRLRVLMRNWGRCEMQRVRGCYGQPRVGAASV